MALLVIVGGGIGGLAAALEAASGSWSKARGNEIIVLREPDDPAPRSEALRAHHWWHSGLHYARRADADLDFAARLGVVSNLMQKRLQFDLQQVPPGVMRIPQRGLALFSLAIQQLGIRSQVRKLSGEEARHLVGPAYQPGLEASYFEVPDRPVAEADVLAVLRTHARAHGIHLRDVPGGVRLSLHLDAPCRCLVEADGQELEPDALLLAAGCGLPGLLEQLGIERGAHQLVVDRTLSLVVTRPVFAASLVADYGGGWAATQLERERYVFTVGGSRQEDVPRARWAELPEDATRALRQRFEQVTRCDIEGQHRVVSSLEIRKRGVPAPAHARPLVERAPRSFPGVVWMLPGRAAMALATAQLAVAELPRPARAHRALANLPGHAWQAPIAMAHSRYYDAGSAARRGAP